MIPKDLVRFWSKVDKQGSCWIWIAAKDSSNYGQFGLNGKLVLAHRLSYELARGEITQGLELDHLCRNVLCVNPEHLEAVTHKVNISRGLTGKINHWESKKTHCKRGHELKEPNLVKSHIILGKRLCKICHNDWRKRKMVI